MTSMQPTGSVGVLTLMCCSGLCSSPAAVESDLTLEQGQVLRTAGDDQALISDVHQDTRENYKPSRAKLVCFTIDSVSYLQTTSLHVRRDTNGDRSLGK